MGIYSEYLDRNFSFQQLTSERKRQLERIAELRGGRDVLVFAANLNARNAPVSIDYSDLLPIRDQLANLKGPALDLILETPGGSAEVAEDIVRILREKYSDMAVIVPGWAKSAGTILAMAGDEILMQSSSALGPIDAQIVRPTSSRTGPPTPARACR
jgi:ClpP class serine protease